MAQPTADPADPAPPRRLPVWGVVAGLSAAAAALAAVLAWGYGALAGHMPLWLAPAAAGLAVLAVLVPTALVAVRFVRSGRWAAVDAGAGVLGSLQGLPRALFLELSGREWSRARRYGHGAALLVVDVDRFARLAEQRGSAGGEAVMAELLKQTAPTLRGADLLARFGDNQMAVFLAHSDPTGALDVAERIRERTEQMDVLFHPAEGGVRKLRVTVSVGVSQLRPAHLNLQALVEDAQDAVLAARQAGGNCVRAAPVSVSRYRTPGEPGGWRDDHRARPQ